MDKVFLTVLNLSLNGSFVILTIMLARLVLKRAPKWISYALWVVAGLRLTVPLSLESVLGLIPFKAQPIPADIAVQSQPRIDSGIYVLNTVVSQALPPPLLNTSGQALAGITPLQAWIQGSLLVWCIGVAALLAFSFIKYSLLRRSLRGAVRAEERVYETQGLESPFVLGFFVPKIYLPAGLSSSEREVVLLHERTHIRRRDPLVKLAAWLTLCMHWFNPLVWLAFRLLNADMEMSCDERVLKTLGPKRKREYSLSLLAMATRPRGAAVSPLAFSEGGAGQRVKNVLRFKKAPVILVVMAVALVGLLSLGLSINRTMPPSEPPEIAVRGAGQDIPWAMGKNSWNNADYDREDLLVQLMDEHSRDSLPVVHNGQAVTIKFQGSAPRSWTLTEYILRDNGAPKYNLSGHKEYALRFPFLSRAGRFKIESNWATAFSSSSLDYLAGNTLKGYRLVCHWGENSCEYAFILRGDAAITMNFEGREPTDPGVALTEPPPSLRPGHTAQKWLDYYYNEDMPWEGAGETLELPEFPGIVFRWTWSGLTATDMGTGKEQALYSGMPVWDVYLADLNGDEFPELCSTVSWGSGIIDDHIEVYDYANQASYVLWNRMIYDYRLYLDESNRLCVAQYAYNDNQKGGTPQAYGELVLRNGVLSADGLWDVPEDPWGHGSVPPTSSFPPVDVQAE